MGIWAIQIFLVLMISQAACQEDTPTAIVERPMVFPEPMMRATAAIDSFFGNESDRMMFLSDGYWPVLLNNTTKA